MTGLQETSGEFFGVINFLLGFVAVIAVLSIVVAGIYYVTSLGDDEAAGKAKKIIKTTLIGFLIISLAYVIVATFAR